MNWFNNLTFLKKLMLSYGLMAAIAAVIGYFGYSGLLILGANQDALYKDRLVPIDNLSQANGDIMKVRGNLLAAISAPNESVRQLELSEQEKLIDETDNLITAYSKTVLVREEEEALPKLQESWGRYKTILHQAKSLIVEKKEDAATALLFSDEGLSAVRATIENFGQLLTVNRKIAAELDVSTDETRDSTTKQLFVCIIVGVAIALGLGYFISKSITTPVTQIIYQIDNADLNSQFNSRRADEIGMLQRSFDKFVGSIKSTLVQVSEATAAVASASSEISSSTEQMAAGSQEQTSQTSEVASAVEEMTKTIVENSRNAVETADTAKQARRSAEEGGKIVDETVSGMKRIADFVNQSAETVKALGKSSDAIGEIIAVIDDIADQTNLLALNAAIEAARAGEQGRGFAVVADEVRKLAERTTKATKEIAEMIKKIQSETVGAVQSMEIGTREVDNGISLADKAGSSLKAIVEVSVKVTDMVSQIAAASEEQSSASEQISKNVEAISSVTNQSAAGTQQIARAAEDLNRLTENLQQLVAAFNLDGNGSATETPLRQHLKQKPSAGQAEKSRLAVRANGKLVPHV
jgi:methyl-accepting chemotaxis protein